MCGHPATGAERGRSSVLNGPTRGKSFCTPIKPAGCMVTAGCRCLAACLVQCQPHQRTRTEDLAVVTPGGSSSNNCRHAVNRSGARCSFVGRCQVLAKSRVATVGELDSTVPVYSMRHARSAGRRRRQGAHPIQCSALRRSEIAHMQLCRDTRQRVDVAFGVLRSAPEG